MNDDLPEIFDQIPPRPVSPALRARTLATVETELAKRRKPRWERVLERSVAALVIIGVGLNAWQFSSPRAAWQAPKPSGPDVRWDEQRAAAPQIQRLPGPFDAGYAQMLIELSEKPAG